MWREIAPRAAVVFAVPWQEIYGSSRCQPPLPSHHEGTAHWQSRTPLLGFYLLLMSLTTSWSHSPSEETGTPPLAPNKAPNKLQHWFLAPQGNTRHQTCPTGHGRKFSLCPQSSSFHTNSSVLSSTSINPEPMVHWQFLKSLKWIPNLHSSVIFIRSASTWWIFSDKRGLRTDLSKILYFHSHPWIATWKSNKINIHICLFNSIINNPVHLSFFPEPLNKCH